MERIPFLGWACHTAWLCMLATAALAISAASADAATARFVTPTGGNTDCISSPCGFKHAVETVAQPGDEVIVAGDQGDYTINSTVDATKLLNIHGDDSHPRPRLIGVLLNLGTPAAGTTVRRLQLENTTAAISLGPPSTGTNVAEDLIVRQTADQGGTFTAVSAHGGWVLRDSLITAVDGDGFGIQSDIGTTELVNLTVIATGASSSAIRASAVAGSSSTFNVKNTIARGGTADLSALTLNTINVSFSNFRANKVAGPGPVNQGAGNQTAVDPLFVNQASGDYHQASGSPTTDAGTTDPSVGPRDFDGEARSQGTAPDIGADELPVASAAPGGGGGAGGTGTGTTPGTSGTPTPTTIATANRLTLSRTVFPAAARGGSIARTTGTTVRYRLSTAARVRFTVERAAPGRRVGRRCVHPTRANRPRPRCTRYVLLRGSFLHSGRADQNSFRFTGRLRGRKLALGRYRLVATPLAADGRRGRSIRVGFRIIR